MNISGNDHGATVKEGHRVSRGKPLPSMRHHVNVRDHIAEVIT
jgi:hypothetical protein